MIRVGYRYEGKTVILTMKGHAEVEQGEQNLVCASASTLFYTFACMAEAFKDGIRTSEIKDEPGDGMIVITAKDEDTYGELVRCLMFVITGLRLLSSQGQVAFTEL